MTDEARRELCIITTRNEAGQHFTQWSNCWPELETAGLIHVHRPVHEPTGLSYDHSHWSVLVTEEGIALVDANPEVHPMP